MPPAGRDAGLNKRGRNARQPLDKALDNRWITT